jgi:hypothetical protein
VHRQGGGACRPAATAAGRQAPIGWKPGPEFDARDNPLRALPAYADLLENLEQWQAGPSAVEQMTVIGSYRLF